MTVTVKLQLDMLLLPSLTVQVTVVVPFWKAVPEAGEQVGAPTEQLSLTVGAGNVTTAVHRFGSVGFVMLPPQVIVGGVLSITVKATMHEVLLFEASVTVTVIGCEPVPLTVVPCVGL